MSPSREVWTKRVTMRRLLNERSPHIWTSFLRTCVSKRAQRTRVARCSLRSFADLARVKSSKKGTRSGGFFIETSETTPAPVRPLYRLARPATGPLLYQPRFSGLGGNRGEVCYAASAGLGGNRCEVCCAASARCIPTPRQQAGAFPAAPSVLLQPRPAIYDAPEPQSGLPVQISLVSTYGVTECTV